MKDNKVYYKVLEKDMYSPYQYFQYELNKTYSTDEELELCGNGFHACKNMYEMILWTDYNALKDCRFFECTLGDKVLEDGHKVVSNSITLIKDIPFEEVDKCIKDNLDTLVHIEDKNVRANVAKQGYGLDILIHDKDSIVRGTVAANKYGLDTLMHDVDEEVRAVVAHRGYGLDILINDKHWRVRAAVALRGYGLDTLLHDEDSYVREIAKAKIYEKEGLRCI